MLALMLSCFINRRDPSDRKLILRALPFIPIILWLGLSVFVTYFHARKDIRDTVWEENPLVEKIHVVTTTFSNFELFDVQNMKHLHSVDKRLNQNILIGRAVKQHESYEIPFEDGRTIINSAVAWIPRVIWPDKPTAGGSDFVTKHTGRRFAKGTSIAVGHVFEFYVNFGTLGVFVGFVLLGVFIRWLDLKATEYLALGDSARLMQYHVLGLVAIQPGSMLFFWVTSMAGAYIIARLLTRWLARQRVV